MLKKILIALVAIIALFLIVVALQPSEFSVERTATMAAPPETVFEQVNDLSQMGGVVALGEARSRRAAVRCRHHHDLGWK
jgi:hypothetical protein